MTVDESVLEKELPRNLEATMIKVNYYWSPQRWTVYRC